MDQILSSLGINADLGEMNLGALSPEKLLGALLEAVPSRIEALYVKTGDQELKSILSKFPAYLTKLKADRENLEMVVRVLGLKEQGLPPDLGAHDPAYYEDN